MAEKWTPGPWEFRPYGGMFPSHRGNIISICRGFPQRWVADAVGQETADEREANARLIAAAPELYAALDAAREELRLIRMKDTGAVYNPALRTQIDIVLAKARGD